MGRQKGDPNRNKHRPSSSSSAASLLQSSKGIPAGFGGYVGSSRVDVSDLQDNEQTWDVDGEAALHLRRLSKKDSTTRMKALKALIILFKERPASELCQLLPNWIFEYKKLVHDDNQQVRECTHNAMSAIAATVGRDLAPHIRMLMGAWWVSQFDPAKEVSAASQKSFQAAFQGPSKRLEALMFCATDVLSYIDSLLKLSPQTISDKLVPIEEATKKYELVISSALLALAAFLDAILQSWKPKLTHGNDEIEPDKETPHFKKIQETIKEVEESAARLCLNHKHFRDFLKSKSSQIRCASYQALCSFARNTSAAFTVKDVESNAGVILGSFAEKDPSCHNAMWDMILYFSKQYPEMWNTSATNKLIMPRLFSFLRHATYGSAKISYPCILPLLSLLPFQKLNLSVQFLRDLFTSLWDGHSMCYMSSEDETVYLKALQECFLWVIHNADRFSAGHEISSVVSTDEYMMNSVFVEVFWKNYSFCGFQAASDSLAPVIAIKKWNNTPKETLDGLRKKQTEMYSNEFIEKLRNCMIDVLSILSVKFRNLVCFFWERFPEICYEAVTLEARQAVHSVSTVRIGCAHRIGEFLSQISKSLPSDESYKQDIVKSAVRPLVAKLFPLVKVTECGDAVCLLATIVSTFGPLSFYVPEDEEREEVCNSKLSAKANDKELDQIFSFMENIIIPWCLEPYKSCLSEKVELLLSFFEDRLFASKWKSVLLHAIMIEDTGCEPAQLNSGKIAVLAVLLEKFRLKFLDFDIDQSGRSQSACQWDLCGLDATAVRVAQSLSLSDPSALRFLRQILGGSIKGSCWLIGLETKNSILKILLQRLLYILIGSGIEWASFAASQLLTPDVNCPFSAVEDEKAFSLAFAAAQALCDNITDLQYVDELEATSKVVATFYCIQWAFNSEQFSFEEEEKAQLEYKNEGEGSTLSIFTGSGSTDKEDDTGDAHTESLVNDVSITEAIQHMVKSISLVLSSGFPMCLTALNRVEVQRILIQCIRYVSFEGTGDAQKMARVCAKWFVGLVDDLCMETEDIQHLLDALLEPSNVWPLYASKPTKPKSFTVPVEDRSGSPSETIKHDRFTALIGNIALLFGWEKLVGCQRTDKLVSGRSTSEGKSSDLEEHCRIWLIIEMLCTWRWPGGNARDSIVPYLVACVDNEQNHFGKNIVNNVIFSLFTSATSSQKVADFDTKYWLGSIDDLEAGEDRCLHALLFVLTKVCQGDKKVEYSEKIFQMLVIEQKVLEHPLTCTGLKVLPFVLPILVPVLRKQQEKNGSSLSCVWNPVTLKIAVLKWLGSAYSAPPLCVHNEFASDLENALQVVVASFPLHSAGGSVAIMAAASANVSTEERSLLASLLQKEACEVPGFVTHVAKQCTSQKESLIRKKDARQFHEEILAKLVASSIAYCWKEFTNQDWAVVTQSMRKWMEATLIEIESFTNLVMEAAMPEKRELKKDTPLSILQRITAVVETHCGRKSDLKWTAVIIFSLLQALHVSNSTESSSSRGPLESINWKDVRDRALSYIAQIYFASGMAESLALDSMAGEAAANLIASYHMSNLEFWENVSDILLDSSTEERKEIACHLNTWTVGKNPVRSLYALLFSSQPIGRVQHAAYSLLTKDPFQTSAVICKDMKEGGAEKGFDSTDSRSFTDIAIRHELSQILEISATDIFESALVSPIRVRYFLAWAIILSYLGSISVSSEVSEKLVQNIQDSAVSSTVLDSIFQHIPLNSEQESFKRKPSSLWQVEIERIGDAARRACALRAVSSAIEGLWPIDEGTVTSLAAGLYGLMLQVLPAFVRVWFTGLRDRSAASSVEYFTTKFCSPLILADEFAKVHNSTIMDDSLTIKANQGLGEITVIYKKEEAGMDMTIKLPKCYPLKVVDIDCTRRLGVSETRLRKWTLSMAAFLRNQNGAVAEAIHIWRQNVDREFEGVEDCPICYSIIHTANHSLPKLACKTCKHKFHAPCLYKWFSTSHKSTCPLCQTPF